MRAVAGCPRRSRARRRGRGAGVPYAQPARTVMRGRANRPSVMRTGCAGAAVLSGERGPDEAAGCAAWSAEAEEQAWAGRAESRSPSARVRPSAAPVWGLARGALERERAQPASRLLAAGSAAGPLAGALEAPQPAAAAWGAVWLAPVGPVGAASERSVVEAEAGPPGAALGRGRAAAALAVAVSARAAARVGPGG